jgi:uncharacterized FAD-dependent dehydrogenase
MKIPITVLAKEEQVLLRWEIVYSVKKERDVTRILELLVAYGATPDILIEAHPHIGTNKLPQIIQDIREKIIECGGVVLFETRVTDILQKTMRLKVS